MANGSEATSDPLSSALRQHVAMRAMLGADMPLARLLIAKGQAYPGTAFRGQRMRAKACFENALKYAEANGLRYAEGFGLSGGLMRRGIVLPVEHAWCVDSDGLAVDPTWDDPAASYYLGIDFKPAEVWKRVVETGTFGIFYSSRSAEPDFAFMEGLMPGLKPGVVHACFLGREEEAEGPDISPGGVRGVSAG